MSDKEHQPTSASSSSSESDSPMDQSSSTQTSIATATSSPTSSPSTISVSDLKSRYQRSARSFLLNDHLKVWKTLSSINDNLTATIKGREDQSPWWVEPSKTADQQELEIRRLDQKFKILRITFLASLGSSDQNQSTLKRLRSQSESSTDDRPASLSELVNLLNRPSDQLMLSIWYGLTNDSKTSEDDGQSYGSPQPSYYLNHLHPSIISSAALASIKLETPHIGKSICEAWLGSLGDETLNYLEKIFSEKGKNEETIDKDQSSSLKRSFEDEVRYSYERLIEVYVIHILGGLGESDFGLEFLKGQSNELGGVLPLAVVQNVIDGLNTHQEQTIKAAKLAVERQNERIQREKVEKKRTSALLNHHNHHQSSSSTTTKKSSTMLNSPSSSENQSGCCSSKRRNRSSEGSTSNNNHNSHHQHQRDSNHRNRESSSNGQKQRSNYHSSSSNRNNENNQLTRPISSLNEDERLGEKSHGYARLRSELNQYNLTSSQRAHHAKNGQFSSSTKDGLIVMMKNLLFGSEDRVEQRRGGGGRERSLLKRLIRNKRFKVITLSLIFIVNLIFINRLSKILKQRRLKVKSKDDGGVSFGKINELVGVGGKVFNGVENSFKFLVENVLMSFRV